MTSWGNDQEYKALVEAYGISMVKLIFKCHYCPAFFRDFKRLVEHFKKTHKGDKK